MKYKTWRNGRRTGQTATLAKRAIEDPAKVIVCSSEKHRQIYLKMGVPLKQTHVVTGRSLEAHLLKKMRNIDREHRLRIS